MFWNTAAHQYTKDTLAAPRFHRMFKVSKTTKPINTHLDSFRIWGSVEYRYTDLFGLIMNMDSKAMGTATYDAMVQ